MWEPCPELNKQIAELSSLLEIPPVDCAHLEVPLDYRNPDTSESITLDLFRINATKEPVLGGKLYNPDGPDGTGAETFQLAHLTCTSTLVDNTIWCHGILAAQVTLFPSTAV